MISTKVLEILIPYFYFDNLWITCYQVITPISVRGGIYLHINKVSLLAGAMRET